MGRPRKNPLPAAAVAEQLKTVEPATIIKPSVKFVGDDKKHALQEIFDGPEAKMPVITSVGTVGVPGTNTWVSFLMKSQGRKIIEISVDQPNLRSIAEESAKISFVNTFMGVE